MAALTEKLHTFCYFDGAAGFRAGRPYPPRYQMIDASSVSIGLSHVVGNDDQLRAAPAQGQSTTSAARNN